MLLAPSILASDFTDLKSEIKKIEEIQRSKLVSLLLNHSH